ncbi:hypothetical protein [Flavobacterium hydrophilum]|uniref:HEPN domain-containing protein n=1 Tax=Flavobacterium hydrophilum TaxID=2211445 RepID=A0A2V4C579_9FLAO|nr:hypothetical protein [Flavobacterium hydrophilum]PXY46506.1 hypothetical protein DMB68_04855 [Flavobacterium hydrophilum]
MKAIDDLGLQTISNIISKSISTSSIYCFGERKQIQAVQNPFQESVSTHKEQTHFYLMVLTDEYVMNAVADISDIIKTKTEGQYTVTLLFFKVKYGHYLCSNQRYFYHQVLTKGYKFYERENMPLNITFDEITKRNIDYIRSYWKNRKKVAETFLISQNQVDYMDTGFVQDSMMHIAVEQICLGLINVFLGYHPDHFSLAYLFDLCEIFSPITSEFFPRITSEDKRLFDLLKTNPSSLRWINVKKSSLLDTEHLERRCNLFYEKACEIVEAELERIKNLSAEVR